MFSFVSNYDEDFPKLSSFDDKTRTISHQPKVSNSTAREANGSTKNISPAEAVFNWQTNSMVTQNKSVKQIDQRLIQVDSKVSQLDQGLINMQNVIA